jgi:hypothetical protein
MREEGKQGEFHHIKSPSVEVRSVEQGNPIEYSSREQMKSNETK